MQQVAFRMFPVPDNSSPAFSSLAFSAPPLGRHRQVWFIPFMHKRVGGQVKLYDFYCVLLYFFYLFCLSDCVSLCVCVWAMLPDSNKMMMMRQTAKFFDNACHSWALLRRVFSLGGAISSTWPLLLFIGRNSPGARVSKLLKKILGKY